MSNKRYKIILREEERTELLGLIKTGKERARKLNHARIVLEADESELGSGLSDKDISARLHVSIPTIERVRKQCVEEGLERALNHKPPYKSRSKKLDGLAQAKLAKLACSQAPEGRARWTISLLADELVKLEVVESIADETVRQELKKMNLNLG
jgi:transposase